LGVFNISALQFNATQIFSTGRIAGQQFSVEGKNTGKSNTNRAKIDVVVDITKAFYDVLATAQQVKVISPLNV
jgi:hypothetical protein